MTEETEEDVGPAVIERLERLVEDVGNDSPAPKPRQQGADPPLSALEAVEKVGMAMLVVGVAGTLGVLGLMLTFFGLGHALSVRDVSPQHEGVELVLFPLVVVATTMLLHVLRRDAPVVRGERMRLLLPLLAAPVLPGIAVYLGLTWEALGEESVIGLWRLPGAVMIAAAAFAGTLLYPRLAIPVAGAIATPALFGLLVLPLPGRNAEDHPVVELIVLLLWVGGPLLLGYASYRLWPRPLSHALGLGAITLFLSIIGYAWALGVS